MNTPVYPTVTQAALIPDHPAIICDGRVVSYAELESRIIADARRLRELGVRAGDRVALGAANSDSWIVLAHAVVRAGGVLVPLNTRLASGEIQERLRLFTPRLLIGDETFLSQCAFDPVVTAEEVIALTGADGSLRVLSRIAPSPEPVPEAVDLGALATIISTSGSTGTPKGVCLTLANHLASAAASARNLGVGPPDRWLVNLPLYHVGGLAVIYRTALHGATMIVHGAFDSGATLHAIRNEGVTHLSLVATTLKRLLEAAGDDPFPDSLIAALVGGGPVDPVLLQRARSRNMPVLPTYGMTEASSQVATLPPDEAVDWTVTLSRPLPTCAVQIRDASNRMLSPGTEGEIWIRGPMVAAGTWRTDQTVVPITAAGWYATGDMGVLDSRGLLEVRGRKDDMIISGGENVFPSEIEQALQGCPGIKRAFVFGIADPEWGQVPVAVVECDADTDADMTGIQNALRGQLAAYKLPRGIVKVSALPVTSLGKIDRVLARGIYQAAVSRTSH